MAASIDSKKTKKKLASLPRDGRKVLILADPKAAISAVKRAGRTGKARSRHLQKVVNTVAEIKEGGEKSNWGGEGPHGHPRE